MKNLGEKEKNKKNIDSLDNVLDDMSTVEKLTDDIMKGLHFIILLLILLVIVVFILSTLTRLLA